MQVALTVALRKESVDRNQEKTVAHETFDASLSARRAWIEILVIRASELLSHVALRKESVDRNKMEPHIIPICMVALRKESVDRNTAWAKPSRAANVALRKESVDRNRHCVFVTVLCLRSLSARRAWIEI